MKTIETISQQYCHEYRKLGDLHASYGFGSSPEAARQDAVYGQDNGSEDTGRDHPLGFGDWELQEDENREYWVTMTNKNAA